MNKKLVLITGNQGFVGAWTTLFFLRKSWEVIGLDNRSSFGERLYDELGLDIKLKKQYNLDICDVEGLTNLIKLHKPSLVINLAGQAIVPRAFREPFETFRTNTLGTLSVLEAVRRSEISLAICCITSDKVYQNNEQVWPYRENDRLGGKDIYSVSKSSAELVVAAFAKTHLEGRGVNVQSVRLGNVVGGGDWSRDRLIPDMMTSLRSGGGNFFIRYPEATRPFQHVLDVCSGIYKIGLAAMEGAVATGEAWNLGPKHNTFAKVKDVVKMCRENWPQLSIEENPSKVAEDLNLSVEVAKYSRAFEPPKYTSDEALNRAISWYDGYFKKVPIKDLVENDFLHFEE